MTDPIRSKIMRSIKSRDTKPELLVRKSLHRAGFRYRVNQREIVGRPDIVLPKFNAIILVNGCFWHAHSCHIFRLPKDAAWRKKLDRNRERDAENLRNYAESGWKVLRIWECALQGKTKLPFHEVHAMTSNWIQFGVGNAEIMGKQ